MIGPGSDKYKNAQRLGFCQLSSFLLRWRTHLLRFSSAMMRVSTLLRLFKPFSQEYNLNIAHNLIANYRFVLNFRTNIWIKLGDLQSQLNSCFVNVGPIKNAYHYDLRCCSSTLGSSSLVAHTFFISGYQQRHIAQPCTTFLQDVPAV